MAIPAAILTFKLSFFPCIGMCATTSAISNISSVIPSTSFPTISASDPTISISRKGILSLFFSKAMIVTPSF